MEIPWDAWHRKAFVAVENSAPGPLETDR